MFENEKVVSYSNEKLIDEGLRSYMLKVYNYMAGGLVATGAASWLVASNPAILKLFITPHGYSGLGFLTFIALLVVIFSFNSVMRRGTVPQLQALFWGFSALMGITMAPIFLIYTGTSIMRVFLITAATFGSLSLYGYTTKKDLTGWGNFLFIGLIGLIIASIVNIFLKSSGLGYAFSYLTVFIFAGLTAYNTQNLKSMYFATAHNEDFAARSAISGALSLYLDFINMFTALLRIMGDRN